MRTGGAVALLDDALARLAIAARVLLRLVEQRSGSAPRPPHRAAPRRCVSPCGEAASSVKRIRVFVLFKLLNPLPRSFSQPIQSLEMIVTLLVRLFMPRRRRSFTLSSPRRRACRIERRAPRAVPLCSLPAPRGTDRPRYAWPTWSRRSGSSRIGLPVALKTALATAGAIGGTPGSPTPVGASAEATMWTSTFGISLIRNGK